MSLVSQLPVVNYWDKWMHLIHNVCYFKPQTPYTLIVPSLFFFSCLHISIFTSHTFFFTITPYFLSLPSSSPFCLPADYRQPSHAVHLFCIGRRSSESHTLHSCLLSFLSIFLSCILFFSSLPVLCSCPVLRFALIPSPSRVGSLSLVMTSFSCDSKLTFLICF